MPESKSTDIKTPPPATKTPPSKGSGRGGGGQSQSQAGRGNKNKSQQQPKPIVAKFEGMCKKDLSGKVIMYSESRPSMAAQWLKFEDAIYNAAGRLDPMLATAIAEKKELTLGDFLPRAQKVSEYSTKDAEGKDVVDTEKKVIYDKAADILINKDVDGYTLYLKNWKIFFF